MFQKRKKIVEQDRTDYDLLKKIEPAGGITSKDEKYISSGNAYIACIHVFGFPRKLNRHWMTKLCNIPNTIAVIDVSTENMNEVITNINKSIGEQKSRIDLAKTHTELRDSQNRLQELDALYNEISNYGEIIKNLQIRIFVANRNMYLLQEQIDKIISKLEVDKFKTAVFLNEGKQEFESLLKPYKEQIENKFTIPGQELTATAVAGGNPYHFSSLEDKYGLFLGQTPSGGTVLFDLFTKTQTRLYYNAVVIGTMRSGKSTLLKKQFIQRAIQGDFIRAFDITGEFTSLTNELGGKIISGDGTSGIQNPFQILKSAESDSGSFARHISKLATWYQFLVPEVTANELTSFKNLLNEFYKKYDLVPRLDRKNSITEFPSDYYPIMEDFYEFLIGKINMIQKTTYKGIEKEARIQEFILIENLAKIFQDLISNYGHIFNGHTNFDNLKDVQIITYDMSRLKEMEPRVFDAQLFNLLSTNWDNCVTNGTVMKELYEQGKITWEEIVHFCIIIDESHRWLNVQKTYAVDLITKYAREAPKFFGGLIFASQSIRDYVPSGDMKGVDELKKLFELTQYKFIFHQDTDALPLIDQVFEQALTQTQRNRIPTLGQGECILSISSDRNIDFKVYLSKEEEKLFTGGV